MSPVKTYPARLVCIVLSQVLYLSSFPSKSLASAISCLGSVRFSGSTGVIPKLDKSISVNAGVGMIGPSSGCMLLLGVLVIAGDPLGVVCLLKGDINGPSPVIRLYLSVVDTGVDVPVTGVCDAGGLLPSSALSYCSSPDVKVSVLGSGSESELSAGALCLIWVEGGDAPSVLGVTGSYVKLSSSIVRSSTTVLVVETKWVTTTFAWPSKRHESLLYLFP
ncbi:uncharacterized protein LACBIDRAFT_335400 [Laccaria bicolor S238N-H82]|uniref:Predicted protein n=1 Tax=Laccaria bicolor (strain S238N-H82 / ATCC MYA-4686) TaxID=486041 RepID=B0E284_LACBS|nr:uncharacterized protein LACBIDRAFT_335400 [Laccaria bicolor S238N-H82]EDQ99052.1 predicted protein [Laccaria bicolor S238N-H82]|eukprot:XP_001890295.1 predicted protein [Laccaria bicolor S238N-H82]